MLCGDRDETIQLGGEGVVQKILIWPYEQVVYAKPGISPREWDAQSSLGFRYTNGSPNLGQMTILNNSQKKKKRKKKEDLPKSRFFQPGRPQNENKWKRKER